uniref:PEPxxWA-CTERM sorting domain-containing protein n=1 Tax=Sphingomonas sp. TaxID=28214 RepID=UPI0025D27B3F|nr:PEPxxWA-CTERM sorting domain-containing protein [Sphingomonas sp.]
MKMMTKMMFAAGVYAFAAPAIANAAVAIDQQQTITTVSMAVFSQTGLAQSFRQSASNITGAGVYLTASAGSGPGSLTIALYTNLPNVSGATLLASGSANYSANNQWIDVSFTPTSIVSNQTYYLVFTGTSGYGIAGSVNNPYAFGQTYANPGYGSFPAFDYAFRTYADTAVAAVPEPATWSLMVLGFGMIGAAARSRKVKTTVSFA